MSAHGFLRATGGAPADSHSAGGPPAGAALLHVSDLRVGFRQGQRVVRAVDGLSYTVCRAPTVAIIGESGSGKTVSSRAIMGLLAHSAKITGSIQFEGTELVGLSERPMRRYRGGEIAMIFQDPSRSLNPTIRIGP